ncbi:hypothetical protein C5167_038728 [Papaver somniferum]|uniref:Uncharacterized protein n=1 Tax=Papaver somniferum TaxID=3469 RepID=A0A4Y7IA03_PAPSO|nr:hypothetical protein C5167_038728 [Papaver somniferum]
MPINKGNNTNWTAEHIEYLSGGTFLLFGWKLKELETNFQLPPPLHTLDEWKKTLTSLHQSQNQLRMGVKY